MKNKDLLLNCLALLLLNFLAISKALAQDDMSFSSVSFNALNNIYVAPAPVVQPEPAAVAVNYSNTDAPNMGVAMYPYYLCLNYAVPYYVYKDWKYLQYNAARLIAMPDDYYFNSSSLQNSFEALAFTGFASYSEFRGQQKLEFRRGSRIPTKYEGIFPQVVPNTNPVIKTLIFSAQ